MTHLTLLGTLVVTNICNVTVPYKLTVLLLLFYYSITYKETA